MKVLVYVDIKKNLQWVFFCIKYSTFWCIWLDHFFERKPLYIWRVTRKSQRKLIKKKRLFVLRPKTNHGWCRPALFDLVKGPFISKRISFSFAILKRLGKKSNTQKRAMKIIHSNFASWEQNNLWPKCFF